MVGKVLKVLTDLYPKFPWVVMPQGGRGRPACYCSDVRQVIVVVVGGMEGFLNHLPNLPWIVMPRSGKGGATQFAVDWNAVQLGPDGVVCRQGSSWDG